MFCTVFGALLFGFLAGVFAFKVKSRWCPECGVTTLAVEERRRAAGR